MFEIIADQKYAVWLILLKKKCERERERDQTTETDKQSGNKSPLQAVNFIMG